MSRRSAERRRTAAQGPHGRQPARWSASLVLRRSSAIGTYFGFTKDDPVHARLPRQGRLRVGQLDPHRTRRCASPASTSARSSAVERAGRHRTPPIVTMEIKDKRPADPQGRDDQDPAAHLPRGQLLRRPRSPARRGAPTLDDGDTIPITQTATPVQLDQVLTALQSDTREDLKAAARGLRHGADLRADRRRRRRRRTPTCRGETAAESLNDAVEVRGAARCATPRSSTTRCSGTERARPLRPRRRPRQGHRARSPPTRPTLQDLVTNFNATMARSPSERGRTCARRSALLAPDAVETPTARSTSLNAALPDHARLRPRDPARRPRDAGDDRRAFPWIDQTRRLLGAERAARPGAASCARRPSNLARVIDATVSTCCRRPTSSPQCLDEGDPADRRHQDRGRPRSPPARENYKEFWYTMVGLAGEGQNFDGNGQYVRFQTGGGDQTISHRQAAATPATTLFGNASTSRRSARGPRYPGKRPPYNCDGAAARTRSIPDLNGAKTGPPDGGGTADRARADGRSNAVHAPARAACPPTGDSRHGRARRAPEPVPRRRPGREARDPQVLPATSPRSSALVRHRGWSSAATSCPTSASTCPSWVPVARHATSSTTRRSSPTAQSITPGQGQTVNIAGVPVGEIVQGRARRRPRGRHDEDPQQVHADLQGRDRARCARRPASTTWSSSSTPGSKAAGELPTRARDPDRRSTLPNVNLDEILAGARRRHARLPAAAARRRRRGPGRQRQEPLGDASAASSRRAATSLKLTTRARRAPQQHQAARSTTSASSSEAVGDKDDDLAQLVDASNAVFASFANQDAAACARRSASCPATLRGRPTRRWPRPTRSPRSSARRSSELRPAARALGPSLRADAPVPARRRRRSSATQLRPFARDALPTVQALRPAARDLADLTPDLTKTFDGRQLPAQRRWPTTRPGDGGGLPLLALVGQPPRRRRSSARQDAHGPIRRGAIRRRLLGAGDARPDQAGQPAAGHDHRPAQRAAATDVCPGLAARQAPPARTGAARQAAPEVTADDKQAPTFGRLFVMVGFALSCFGLLLFLWLAFGGPMPLKPQGLPRPRRPSARPRSSPRRPTSGSPACRSARSRTIDDRPEDRAAPTPTIELEARYAPLPSDAKAILRQKTLLGETYVELTPGTPTARRRCPRTARCRPRRSPPTVELDEIFRAFDPETRDAPSRRGCSSRPSRSTAAAQDISDALGNLAPFAEDTDKLLRDPQLAGRRRAPARAQHRRGLRRAQRARRPARRRSSRTPTASSRRPRSATRSSQETFRALPTFERESDAHGPPPHGVRRATPTR